MQELNFDDIRPYYDSEVREKMQLLINDPIFGEVLFHIYKEPAMVEKMKLTLASFETIADVQGKFIFNLLRMIIATTSQGLFPGGIEELDKNKAYLYISNHRDIILDSALLNYLLFGLGMNTTQIAIGHNLLLYDWIIHAVKLNRAFVIKRNISIRELLESSKKISQYIRKSISADNISVWIAQREGRTKDGFDKTQESLLKMLNISNSGSLIDGFKQLNIVPVAISYEIEPCGISKVRELIIKEREGYKKTSKDDLKSMAMGMFNQKGRIHFEFCSLINSRLDELDSSEAPNIIIEKIAGIIDREIYRNYKLWPNNYIAYDLMNDSSAFKGNYTNEEKQQFLQLVDQAAGSLNEFGEEVRTRFIKVYATPVINFLQVTS